MAAQNEKLFLATGENQRMWAEIREQQFLHLIRIAAI